jgi:shikimate kinase
MNYIIGGPCGIGKSTIAQRLAHLCGIVHLDLDKIRIIDMKRLKGRVSPCSLGYLNLNECLKDILDDCEKGFVLDTGGGTIFRKGKDNTERLNQVIWLKTAYNAKVIVLFAEKREACQRFLATKNREANEFDNIWNTWEEVEKPYWLECSDKSIDTTGLTSEYTIPMIVES